MRKVIFVLGMMAVFVSKGQWSEVGGQNSLSANGYINSICSDTNGYIYAAGGFTNASGKHYVAKYNGNTWNELGGVNSFSPNYWINSICSDKNGNIYAAGQFNNTNGRQYVAKYNGTTWSELGGINSLSANNEINSICIDAVGNIYAAGGFTNTNGRQYVAKYNGTTWSELGGNNSSLANSVISCISSDAAGNVYSAGYFTNTNGKQYVAKYNGTTWSELGGTNSLSANNTITSICCDAIGNIYATGYFNNSSGQQYVAKYNGTNWSELGGANSLSANDAILSIFSDAAGSIYAGVDIIQNFQNHFYIAKYNGITWNLMIGTPQDHLSYIKTICSDFVGNIYVAGQFKNSNAKFYVSKYLQTLPLQLLSFTAHQKNNNVLLNWQTANELNVSHINIQRSNNGKDFEKIGRANANCCSYSFTDNRRQYTVDNKLYYRLEIVDKDGSKTYSTIQQITIQHQTPNIVLFPNPAKDVVKIDCAGAKQLLIIDNLGRTVYNIVFQSPSFGGVGEAINCKQLTKGVYIVKAIMNNGEIRTEKLVID